MTPRPAVVRFYIDADLLGLAKLLVQVRSDVTYPGDPGGVLHRRERPACVIRSPDVPDETWIPVVARLGWVIITRDARLQDRPGEIAAVRDHAAKVVNLTADSAGGTFGQLQVVLRHWTGIEALCDEPGPVIVRVTVSSFKRMDLG